ncbi:MAG TPA: hydrogenase maturation nickel metallochaperone HypA [Thermoanaerobaculia bacterium]
MDPIPMHEYGIVRALLDRVEAEAQAHRATAVRSVQLRIGELSGVEPELLGFAFEAFAGGTMCANARLQVSSVPARWECPACATEVARDGALRCPACGGAARLAAGGEIILERLELEVPDVS